MDSETRTLLLTVWSLLWMAAILLAFTSRAFRVSLWRARRRARGRFLMLRGRAKIALASCLLLLVKRMETGLADRKAGKRPPLRYRFGVNALRALFGYCIFSWLFPHERSTTGALGYVIGFFIYEIYEGIRYKRRQRRLAREVKQDNCN